MTIDLYKNYFTKIVAFFIPPCEERQHVFYIYIPKNAIKYPVTGIKYNDPKRRTRYTFQRVATLLVATFMSFTQTHAAVTGPGAAWGYCRKITLSAATPVANFQVKITLTTATLGNPYSNINSAGNDLRFYDVNNNLCNYWIESFANNGTSTIWVNVVSNAATVLYMYYGNAAAPSASNGATTFDFFDDFTSPLGANWSTITSGGSVTQSGTNVTLSNTNGGTVSLSNTSPFTISGSFQLEAKHSEAKYNRNRFYAANSVFAGNPFGFDNGYFYTGSNSNIAQNTAQVFWNGAFQAGVTRNTNYLSQWQITDGSTYTWRTLTYPAMALVQTNTATYTNSDIRFISISVTEVGGTSTSVDWVRVRKANAAFTDPTGTVNAQFTNISASISAQTNVLCNGQSTGSAKVTASGGGTPYSYSWNSSPVQTVQTAINLPAGTYIATVTDNNGISATATATLIQPVAVNASATSNNISCFNASDGQIQVTGSNGILPYMFSINNGGSYQSANSFINLPPGNYKIRVKDNNGCQSALVP